MLSNQHRVFVFRVDVNVLLFFMLNLISLNTSPFKIFDNNECSKLGFLNFIFLEFLTMHLQS